MKIATGLLGNATAKFSTRVMKLIFKITSTHADTTTLLAALKASTIEVTSTHPSYATKTRLYKNPLLDLMELATSNEGAVRIDGAAGAYTVRGSIELSDDGAITPLENEQFVVSLSLAVNLTSDINVFDIEYDAKSELEYKPVPCFGGSPTPLQVASSKFIAIPKDKLTKLELELPSGRKIEYDTDELEQYLSEANEQALITNGLVTPGSINLFVLNVAPFIKAHVTTTEQVNVYLVNVK